MLHPETRHGENQHTRVRQVGEGSPRFTADTAAKTGQSERALFTKKRKDAYEKLHPETRHGVVGNGREKSRQLGDSTERFTADTAARHGTPTVSRQVGDTHARTETSRFTSAAPARSGKRVRKFADLAPRPAETAPSGTRLPFANFANSGPRTAHLPPPRSATGSAATPTSQAR